MHEVFQSAEAIVGPTATSTSEALLVTTTTTPDDQQSHQSHLNLEVAKPDLRILA